ncbi:MAG: diguanylate cyclase [Cellvibrionaceae bacterium]|nr:diguanylate cyclase [Cellvibrionaceae bacterium]
MTIKNALIVNQSKTTTAISASLLEDLAITFEAVSCESDAWALIQSGQLHFDLILVSRSTFAQGMAPFVANIKALAAYSDVPIIILVGEPETEDKLEALYAMGFTQVFSLQEFNLLEDYIRQFQARDTLHKDKKNKVVILEDDLGQQLLVQAIFEEKQCECFCFTAVEDALDAADSLEPDLIVSDFFLAGKMTGLDLVVCIKQAQHPWSHLPVLVMTGLDDAARKSELVRSGANDYIAKPIDPVDLVLRAENLIRYKQLLDTVEQQKTVLHHLAMHDQLTGLYNRHFVVEHVQMSIAEAKRHGHDYALIVLDVDNFKIINDKHGHDRGDHILKAVADTLKHQCRVNDVVARLGGEEFLILMSHCNFVQAMAKAEKLRLSLYELKPMGLRVSASFGVAQLDDDLNTYEKLFKAADRAVYQAKQKGRNCVQGVCKVTDFQRELDAK